MSDIPDPQTAGAATGGLRTLLRLEGLALFAGMTLLYAVWDGSWWVYAILFLVPDLSFLGYLAGPQAGAVVYNAAHSYLAPMTLMVAGFSMASPLVLRTRPRPDLIKIDSPPADCSIPSPPKRHARR